MIEKYLAVCELLEQGEASFGARLKLVHDMIKKPDFQYDPLSCPDILTNIFLLSSYHLDRELFDESYLYKTLNQPLLSDQNAHLKIVDIGATLLKKGFSLEYNPENFVNRGPDCLATYVKTFVKQCHKRHAFLSEKNLKSKILPFIPRKTGRM